MKKYLDLLLFVFATQFVNSQITYFNYLDYTSEWRIYGSEFNGWCCIETSYKTAYFDGDTTINGKVYYKQFTSVKKTTNNWATVTTSLDGPVFFREDSTGKFFRYINNNIEFVDLDNQKVLNYQLNDTLHCYNCSSSCCVGQIITHNLGFTQLKHVFGSNTDMNTGFVEGVGYLGIPCGLMIEGDSRINCYTKQNNTIGFGPINCDSFPIPQRTMLVTNLQKAKKVELNIYPNPARNTLNIDIDSNDKNNLSIRITDIVGREVLYTDYQNQLTISSLEKGVYFVSVARRGKVLATGKIIKE